MEIENNPCQYCPMIEQLEAEKDRLQHNEKIDDGQIKMYVHLKEELEKQINQMKNCQNCQHGYLREKVHSEGARVKESIAHEYLKICSPYKCKYYIVKNVRGKEDNWLLKEVQP